jgi:hypothetical protein
VPPDDFFDGEWEEPSRTQETAPTRPVEPGDAPRGPRPGRARRGAEQPPREPRTRRPQRTGPLFRRPEGMPSFEGLEWGRLGMLGAGIIVVILVLLLLVRSCGGSSAGSKNRAFFDEQLKPVLTKSDQAAAQLHDLFQSQRALRLPQVQQRLSDAGALAQEALNQARALNPTKEVEPYQPYLLQTLSYRVNGIQCLRNNMEEAYKQKRATAGGAQLVRCVDRLLASDVVYSDSFYAPASKALQDKSIDAQVPTSAFLARSDRTLLTAQGMGSVLQRWKPSTAVNGLHGTKLDSVTAVSGGDAVTLRTGTVNTIKATDVAFRVTVTNGGDFPEFNVKVTITIGEGDARIVKSATIDQIGSKDTQTVEITGIASGSNQIPFGPAVPMKVAVAPVPGERTTANNRATYQIVFSL